MPYMQREVCDLLITNNDPTNWEEMLSRNEKGIARKRLLDGTLISSQEGLTMEGLEANLRVVAFAWT